MQNALRLNIDQVFDILSWSLRVVLTMITRSTNLVEYKPHIFIGYGPFRTSQINHKLAESIVCLMRLEAGDLWLEAEDS